MSVPEVQRCPLCGKALECHLDLGYLESRIRHLLEHTLKAVLKLTLDDLEDRCIGDRAVLYLELYPGEDTWQRAAEAACEEIDQMYWGLWGDDMKEKALEWLRNQYRTTLLPRYGEGTAASEE